MALDAVVWLRARRGVAWLMSLYLALMYFRMGWVKFDPEGFWAGAWERWGYPDWLMVAVGAAEVLGAVALVVPWTATYGSTLLIAVMVGAWVTRFGDGRMEDVAWITLYIVALAWIGWEWRGKRVGPRRGD